MNRQSLIARADLLMQQSRFEQAEELLRGALDGSADDSQVHSRLAICLCRDRDKWQEATREAERAIALAPDVFYSHFVLAIVLQTRGQAALAMEAIDRAIGLEPFHAQAHGLKAQLLGNQRRWEDAVASAETGLSIDPEEETCRSIRVFALERLGRTVDAVREGRDAVQHDPDSPYAHASLGWSQLNSGDHRSARQSFREALRLDPGNEFARSGMMEAIKTGNFFYRWFYLATTAMSRLDQRVAWGLIIGMWLGMRGLDQLATAYPAARPWIMPITLFYLLLVMSSWILRPLFDMTLRFHPFGRHLLSRKERWASNIIAGTIVSGILFSIRPFMYSGSLSLSFLTILLSLYLTIPVKVAFDTQPLWARVLSAVIAVGFALAYLVNALLLQFEMLSSTLLSISMWGTLIYCFVGQWLIAQRDVD